MVKKASSRKSSKAQEIAPPDKLRIDLTKFKPDLSDKEIVKLLGPIVSPTIFFPFVIDTLSPTKTLGQGRTNLTFIAPTIVQIDAATPFARFDVRAQSRRPGISMHFQPSGYGITSTATYIMEFMVHVSVQSTFNLSGSAGPGTVVNAGTKVLNGQTSVAVILQNVPPFQETSAFLEQRSGQEWTWFSNRVRFPLPELMAL